MKTKEIQKSWLFDYSSPLLVLIIGLLGFFALSLAAHLTGTGFSGVLDVHYLEYQSLEPAFLEGFVNISVLILLYTGLNYYLTKEVNLLGITNVVLISRLPFILFTVFNIDNYIRFIIVINKSKFEHGLYDFYTTDLIVLGLFVIVTLVILIYSVLLLQKGFHAALGFKMNRKEKVLFFITLLFAEIISKGIIWAI